jgi:NADP-dependent 3-hydroxy acid dehydrogenase YdfG
MGAALQGRVVAITGASSGIGAATALALAEAGASVALGARRSERIDALVERIEAVGGSALAVPTDVADEPQARAFVAAAVERFGGLDGLVNNAGVMLLGPVEGADVEHWRRMVDVNVLGLLYCTHAALPWLRERGGGDVVNLSSTAGRHARAGAAVYNLTKFGVTAFSEALRQEVLYAGVRVTCIEPGFVETELQGHNAHPAVQRGIEKIRDEIGEVLRPDDVAAAIVYALTQPRHVSVNEILVRPSRQVG